VIPRATALCALLALVFAGCGGGGDEKTIPRDEAARLVELLQEAQVAAGDQDRCDRLLQLVPRIQAEVGDLPDSVDSDTRETLTDGVAQLADHAREECQDTETTETAPTTTTETETVPPPTTETETEPPPTTETEPPPTTETEPPPTVPEPTVPEEGGAEPPGGEGEGQFESAPGQEKNGKGPKPDKGPKGKEKKGHGGGDH
jgi:hypothetical protein